MHAFAQRRHKRSNAAPNAAPSAATDKATKGLILDQGWRYDLIEWLVDPILFRGQLRALRRRTVDLARLQPGGEGLDVGCGTGTLALAVARRVWPAGVVV